MHRDSAERRRDSLLVGDDCARPRRYGRTVRLPSAVGYGKYLWSGRAYRDGANAIEQWSGLGGADGSVPLYLDALCLPTGCCGLARDGATAHCHCGGIECFGWSTMGGQWLAPAWTGGPRIERALERYREQPVAILACGQAAAL